MDAQNTNDAAVRSFQTKFSANYGAGTFPWAEILAALMSLLGGCTIPLTPANIKAQSQRITVQARLFLKLWNMGVPVKVSSKVVAATVKTLKDGSDDEINSWVMAAQENE